jgi:putative Mg2+ transporter-C (MgtC) family protein
MMGGWWQEVCTTVLSEFSYLPNIAEITRITLRLLLAATLGSLPSFEREQQGKLAGVRTHLL